MSYAKVWMKVSRSTVDEMLAELEADGTEIEQAVAQLFAGDKLAWRIGADGSVKIFSPLEYLHNCGYDFTLEQVRHIEPSAAISVLMVGENDGKIPRTRLTGQMGEKDAGAF